MPRKNPHLKVINKTRLMELYVKDERRHLCLSGTHMRAYALIAQRYWVIVPPTMTSTMCPVRGT